MQFLKMNIRTFLVFYSCVSGWVVALSLSDYHSSITSYKEGEVGQNNVSSNDYILHILYSGSIRSSLRDGLSTPNRLPKEQCMPYRSLVLALESQDAFYDPSGIWQESIRTQTKIVIAPRLLVREAWFHSLG